MIYIILFVALILRLINLDQSLWLDEAININAVLGSSFKELVFNYSIYDFHPPLYHVVLKAWTLIVPVSEISLRFPSVIFGVLSVFVTYLIGKKLFEKKTAIIASLLIATSPLHIYYSQEARMYMLAAILAALSIYFFIRLIEKSNLFLWIGFISSTSLMLYSDYLPYMLIPIYFIYLFIFRKKVRSSTLKSFVPSFLLIFIILLPWIMIFPTQFSTGLSTAKALPAWAQVVGTPDIQSILITFVKFTIGRISINNNIIYAIIFTPVAIFTIFLFIFSLFRMSFSRIIIWMWFFIPLVLALAISFIVPVFAYFRFIFILPAFYLIWASSINTINSQKLLRPLLFTALFINLLSITIFNLNSKFQRENWIGATSYIYQNATADTLVLFESAYTVAPFDFYNKNKIKAAGALSGNNINREQLKINIRSLTNNTNHLFLFQYLSGITDPNGILFQEITNAGFYNTNTTDFEGVGFVYEFTR